MKNLLIIFVKNPILGIVKTRLAADIGDASALKVYHQLLEQTRKVASSTSVSKWLFYSHSIEEGDLWGKEYHKKLQKGAGLGEKIANAFLEGFQAGYERICIIGSDCFELDTKTIGSAFRQLESHDFTLGPANDGGYYLLGMNQFEPSLFMDVEWSTSAVFDQTLQHIKAAKKSCYTLRTLTDIDTLDDLQHFPQLKY